MNRFVPSRGVHRSWYVKVWLTPLALLCFVPPMASKAQVLDFQSLQMAGGGYQTIGTTYTEDGFTLTETGGFATLSSTRTEDFRYQGSTALFDNYGGGFSPVRLTKNDGGTFLLNSIELADLRGGMMNPYAVNVTFTGTKADTTTVTQTFTTDAVYGLETFTFTGFSDLVNVDFEQSSPYHQFDNIVLNNAVPAPNSLITGLLGVLPGVCLLLRHRRRAESLTRRADGKSV